MRIEREDLGGVTILRIVGEIDFCDTPQLLDELRSVQQGGQLRILVNLARCTGMVSRAIGILIGFRCELGALGGCFWVLCPSQETKEVLELVGLLEQLVRPEASENEAVLAVQREPVV
ncbi:MAG: STAS domain-containing protein [Planctomycetota bacterium]